VFLYLLMIVAALRIVDPLRPVLPSRETRDRPRCGGAVPGAASVRVDQPIGGSHVPRPLLVAAAAAGVQLQARAVGGPGTRRIQAQPGLHPDDAAVGPELPLLVVAAPAAVDLDHRTVSGAARVQALVAEDAELTGGGVGPLLVGAAVAVPELHLGAVGGVAVGYVEAPAGAHAPDLPGIARRRLGRRSAVRALVQGVEHRVVGLLLVAVAVEQQRVLVRAPG